MARAGTRERILEAALGCFLEHGYEQSSIALIRERSGVSNGALFHHFASKEALAEALYVEAIASFQAGLWDLLARRPRTLRAAVRGVIEHQLGWVEANADRARFVYTRGHLDWDSPGAKEVVALNDSLGEAFERWLEPLSTRGEIRPASMLVISAVVNGPAHSIARRWLSGHLEELPREYVAELADAAWAALRGAPLVSAGRTPRTRHGSGPARGRVTLELLDCNGSVMARGQSTTELTGTRGSGTPGSGADASGARREQHGR